MSARIPTLSQLPLNLQHEIADFVSREQVSALQELLKETRPSREMSTWPPKDPREIIEALGERTLDDVREIFIDIGLDDVLPLLDDARRRQRRSNMMSRSIANGDASLSDQTSSMSSSSSNASDSSRHSQASHSERTIGDPLVIDEQPISCPVCLGGTAAFYVGATCQVQYCISYQWFKVKEKVQGATSEKLIIENVQAGDRGLFTCRVSISERNIHLFTDWCELSIVDLAMCPPTIVTHPQSQEVIEGDDVTFTVDADGVPNPVYQWYKNGVLLKGNTRKNLTLECVESRDSASYCCSVENENGSVLTNTAQLRVQSRDPQHSHVNSLPMIPAISLHPQSMEVTEGSRIQLSCHAIAQTCVYYQWHKDGRSLIGSGDVLTFPSARLADSGQYSCRVFTPQGYDNLSQLACVRVVRRPVADPVDIASMTVGPSFYIVAHPRDVTIEEGGDAVFSCHVELNIKKVIIYYQWYRHDGLPLTKKGHDEERLVLNNVKLSDNNTSVYCVVSDRRASVKSNLAQLVVKTGHHIDGLGSLDSKSLPNTDSDVHIVEQPVSVAAQLGNRVTLSCRAEGPGKLTYQWSKVDAPHGMQELFSSNRSALILYSLSHYNCGKYVCKVTGADKAMATTDPAEVTILEEDAYSEYNLYSAMATDLSESLISSEPRMLCSSRSNDESYQSYPDSNPAESSARDSLASSNYSNRYEQSPHSLSPTSPISCSRPLSTTSSTHQDPVATSKYVNVDDVVNPRFVPDESHSSTLSTLRREMAQCSFIKQPESQELVVGDTLRLTVDVVGFPIPSYRWYKDNRMLATTSKVLVTKGVNVDDGGIYYCEAVNEMGIVHSEDAFVKVKYN